MPGETVFDVLRASEADAAAIAEVNAESGRAGWAGFIDRERLGAFEPPVSDFRRLLAGLRPPSSVLVASEQGVIVGFASVLPAVGDEAGAGELRALYTRPRVWGRGAGRLLMDRALAELSAAGFSEAVLWTEERNTRPRRIYERAGWRLDGATREREFLGTRIGEVCYRISLADRPSLTATQPTARS